MKRSLVLIVAAAFLCTCVRKAIVDQPKMWGDEVTLNFRNWTMHDVELLAISGDSLYCLDNVSYEIAVVQFSDLRSVYIHDYTIRPELRAVAATPSVLTELITLYALLAGQEHGLVTGLVMLATAGTIYGFSTTTPKVRYQFPIREKHIEKLKLYCRYPQGLTDEQWKELLGYHNQEDFVPLTGEQ